MLKNIENLLKAARELPPPPPKKNVLKNIHMRSQKSINSREALLSPKGSPFRPTDLGEKTYVFSTKSEKKHKFFHFTLSFWD